MLSAEEAKLIAGSCITGVVLAQLDELVPNLGCTDSEIKTTVSKAIDVIQANYHLVPKVTFSEEEAAIDVPAPEGTIDYVLSEMWTSVSN